MVFSVSVGEAGALLAGAGVVVAVVVVVVVVVGVWLPLVPQAVLSAPIAMSTAPPATAIRRRSSPLRAFMCNSDLRINFLARAIRETIRSSYCHQRSNTARGQWLWLRMSRVRAWQYEHVAATIANPIQ